MAVLWVQKSIMVDGHFDGNEFDMTFVENYSFHNQNGVLLEMAFSGAKTTTRQGVTANPYSQDAR